MYRILKQARNSEIESTCKYSLFSNQGYSMKGIIVVVVIIMLLMISIVIGSQNTQMITVNYLVAKAELRVSTFMVITIALGFLIGFLMMVLRFLGLKMQNTLLQRRLKKLSKDSA
jgi:putative membrane protein